MDEKIELTGSELKQLLNQRREEVRKKDSTDERIEITKLKEARIRIANIMTESQVVNLIYDFVKSKKKSLDFAGGDIAKHPGPDDSYRRELIKIGLTMVQEYIEGILIRGEQDRKELKEDGRRGTGDGGQETENNKQEGNNEDRSTDY